MCRTRTGVSLIELLVVIAIIVVLLGLILPAVQQVRETAMFVDGHGRLRQIGLATHHAASVHDGVLPRTMTEWERTRSNSLSPPEVQLREKIDWKRTTHSELLPYIEQQAMYQAVMVNGRGSSALGPVAGGVSKIYQNPLDPTRNEGKDGFDYSVSYVSNAQVFSCKRSVWSGFQDGLSNTIWYSEHYAYCHGVNFDLFSINRNLRYTTNPVGYSSTAPTFADAGYNMELSGQFPEIDYSPLTSGSPPTSIALNGVTFQLRPHALVCDPRLLNSASGRGLQVCMGDGSTRTVRFGIAQELFWAAITPDRGEAATTDW
jgi:prepilin-type N-terminal cleavage/methylation domain-containing protein